MARSLTSRLRSFFLVVRLIARNIECEYLARVANKHDDYIDLLMTCVGAEFMDANKEINGIGCHIQRRPGYCVQGTQRTSEICWEAPVCVTVYMNDQPCLGMAVEFKGSVLHIRQLQGQPGFKVPDNLRTWPALFLNATKNFVNNCKEITSLQLHSAHERISYWHPDLDLDDSEMRLYRQNLRRRYDGTARQCGFKRSASGNWKWDLSLHKAPTAV